MPKLSVALHFVNTPKTQIVQTNFWFAWSHIVFLTEATVIGTNLSVHSADSGGNVLGSEIVREASVDGVSYQRTDKLSLSLQSETGMDDLVKKDE